MEFGKEASPMTDRTLPVPLAQSSGVERMCCDDSSDRHATKHARTSTHPVVASAEPGERWLYPDDAFMEY
ncbi:MAG TPA: UBP-type zinc finger domain-containing protein [Candidatus Binatia bacterium]|nr:UBP-type zinc finger domain-containing protein [Candidatus Binatia bacterium]